MKNSLDFDPFRLGTPKLPPLQLESHRETKYEQWNRGEKNFESRKQPELVFRGVRHRQPTNAMDQRQAPSDTFQAPFAKVKKKNSWKKKKKKNRYSSLTGFKLSRSRVRRHVCGRGSNRWSQISLRGLGGAIISP